MVRWHAHLGVVAQQTRRVDRGDSDVAAVLAEEQVFAIPRINDTAVAAARVLIERQIVLQDFAAPGVKDLDGLRRARVRTAAVWVL